ncbi:hypothetical protein QR680_011710 [Steinernema hermaphroditum]|uniref:Uncharacterized protein n=1 Tax=Steinernema hermaphroditum TaxID=289476 RepID=A0AA39HZG1_9BILA|nr:hypothetical protein QR680_011710 [Steinernema hermaphroditum]
MVAIGYLGLLQAAMLWVTVNAGIAGRVGTCPDLLEANRSATFQATEACVFMLDLNNVQIQRNDLRNDYAMRYRELVEQQPNSPVAGFGSWGEDDVYYFAFSLGKNRDWVEIWTEGALYLRKQYMLSSFINCQPRGGANFMCYGDKTDANGLYYRIEKKAVCKSIDGAYQPIEHGLDVCAFFFSSHLNNTLVVQSPSGPYPNKAFCKLYREELDKDKLTGLDNGHCFKRYAPLHYDIVCCFYGTNNGTFIHEDLPIYLPKMNPREQNDINNLTKASTAKSFCAVFSDYKLTFNYSKDEPIIWEKRRYSILFSWKQFLETHFNEICTSSTKYTFKANGITEIEQTTTAAKADKGNCHEYGKTQKIVENRNLTCPFDQPEKVVDVIQFKACCRGMFCNRMVHDFFGNKERPMIDVNRPCERPDVHPLFTDEYLPYDTNYERRYPNFSPYCLRFLDLASNERLEIDLGLNVGIVWMGNVQQMRPQLRCSVVELQLSVDVDKYEQYCPNSPVGFTENYRNGVPWSVFGCYQNKSEVVGDIHQHLDAYTSYTRCYEYSGENTKLRVDERPTTLNRLSVKCFLLVTETEDYDIKVEAGVYGGNRSVAIASQFKKTCTDGKCHFYEPKLRSSLFICAGNLCNDRTARYDIVKSHTRDTLKEYRLSDDERTVCREETDEYTPKVCRYNGIRSETFGCFMERPMNATSFSEMGCLRKDGSRASRKRAICEHQLLKEKGKTAFCAVSEEEEDDHSIFCCCRDDAKCEKLRKDYKQNDLFEDWV